MDIMELGAIGELIGGFAVIASLVFVGFQVRQTNQLARNAAIQAGRIASIEATRLVSSATTEIPPQIWA